MSILEETINQIRRFTKTSYGSGTFDTNEFQLFYVELGGKNPALFVLVADAYANLEKIIPFSYIVAEKVSKLLNFEETTMKIPEFDLDEDNAIRFENSANEGFKVKNLLFIGPEEVGKSALLEMYVNGKFKEEYKPTIGVSLIEKDFMITRDLKFKFYLLDMAGLRAFAKIRKYYYGYSNAVIIVFDYSNPESIEHINEWIEESRHFIEGNAVPHLLVGNKIDVVEDRNSIRADAHELAEKYDYRFFETSALTGEGIDELFTYLISNMCN